MELLKQNLRPKDILNEKAFENALRSDMALGCSSNTVLHLLAIAYEAGVNVTMDLIDEISKTTPQLCKLNPASEVFITDLNEVGGIQSVLNLQKQDWYIRIFQQSVVRLVRECRIILRLMVRLFVLLKMLSVKMAVLLS